MSEARNHLEAELRKFQVPFGVDNYKLLDVHTSKELLNVVDEKIKMRGGTDLIVTFVNS